jgi:hypothetical protein
MLLRRRIQGLLVRQGGKEEAPFQRPLENLREARRDGVTRNEAIPLRLPTNGYLRRNMVLLYVLLLPPSNDDGDKRFQDRMMCRCQSKIIADDAEHLV